MSQWNVEDGCWRPQPAIQLNFCLRCGALECAIHDLDSIWSPCNFQPRMALWPSPSAMHGLIRCRSQVCDFVSDMMTFCGCGLRLGNFGRSLGTWTTFQAGRRPKMAIDTNFLVLQAVFSRSIGRAKYVVTVNADTMSPMWVQTTIGSSWAPKGQRAQTWLLGWQNGHTPSQITTEGP